MNTKTVWIDDTKQNKPIELRSDSVWRQCIMCNHITINSNEYYCEKCRSSDWEVISGKTE